MRRLAQVRLGRMLALGLGLWFRRFFQLHLVAVACLAPLALVPVSEDPLQDGRIFGLYGLYSSAWFVSFDLIMPMGSGFAGNVTIAYLAQFAVMAIVVRDAHQHLAGREGRRWRRAVPGLLVYALASLGVLVAVDSLAGMVTLLTSPMIEFVGVAGAAILTAILAARFWLALPAGAIDGHGFFAALGRSRRLARGASAGIGVAAVLLVVLQGVTGLLCASVSREPWTFALPAVLFVTLKGCVLAAAYREVCLVKEGPAPEEISAVFA